MLMGRIFIIIVWQGSLIGSFLIGILPYVSFQAVYFLFSIALLARVASIEDITRWREDMNFMFEWQEQYLTSERSERVRCCSCQE